MRPVKYSQSWGTACSLVPLILCAAPLKCFLIFFRNPPHPCFFLCLLAVGNPKQKNLLKLFNPLIIGKCIAQKPKARCCPALAKNWLHIQQYLLKGELCVCLCVSLAAVSSILSVCGLSQPLGQPHVGLASFLGEGTNLYAAFWLSLYLKSRERMRPAIDRRFYA